MLNTASLKIIALQLVLFGLCDSQFASAESNASTLSDRTSNVFQRLPRVYEEWLEQDVRWIIISREQAAFLRLSQDEERDRFIKQFWKRRDPTPDTVENEYKDEHYRRIAYANIHFGWDKISGWETDRGRTYIRYGPPDRIEHERLRFGVSSDSEAEIWHFDSLEMAKPWT
jgi:GWxTD domain-containing protein